MTCECCIILSWAEYFFGALRREFLIRYSRETTQAFARMIFQRMYLRWSLDKLWEPSALVASTAIHFVLEIALGIFYSRLCLFRPLIASGSTAKINLFLSEFVEQEQLKISSSQLVPATSYLRREKQFGRAYIEPSGFLALSAIYQITIPWLHSV